MKVGVSTSINAESYDVAMLAKRAEELGFESFFVPEHTIMPVNISSRYHGSADGSIPESMAYMVDPLITLARASAATEKIMLGTGVLLVPEHNPVLLGKEVATLDYLSGALGADSSTWVWGRAHTMSLRHPLATNAAAERVLNPPPIPCPGGSTMVNNRSSREGPNGFETTGGPSYRLVADLSGIDAQGCLLAGQSGQPGSPHYSDQAALWPRGRLHPLLMDPRRIERESESETVLIPYA